MDYLTSQLTLSGARKTDGRDGQNGARMEGYLMSRQSGARRTDRTDGRDKRTGRTDRTARWDVRTDGTDGTDGRNVRGCAAWLCEKAMAAHLR